MNITKLIASNNEHGSALMIIGGRKCSMASVRSYTEYNNVTYGESKDLDAEIASAKQRGHALFWITKKSTTICGDAGFYEREEARWASAPQLNVGDVVEFEGNNFRIESAPNNNFRPVIL